MPSRRIAVIQGGGDTSAALVVAGINDFRREHPGWELRQHYAVPSTQAEIVDMLDWKADGYLVCTSELPDALRQERHRVVGIRHQVSSHGVLLDELAIGELAARHLVDIGVPNLAWLSHPAASPASWLRLREEGCRLGLQRLGRTGVPIVWEIGRPPTERLSACCDRLLAIPGQVALYTQNDWFANEIEERLLTHGVAIPDRIALLGTDDLPGSATLTVPLSSVQPGHRSAGYAGARLLQRLIDDPRLPPVHERIAPEGIAIRDSTDPIRIADPEVASMLRFMRGSLDEAVAVDDIIAGCDGSRRSLEMRFKRVVGRGIHQELTRQRIERAKTLLVESQDGIADIAAACGFADAAHLAALFRRATGESPSAWRRTRTRTRQA